MLRSSQRCMLQHGKSLNPSLIRNPRPRPFIHQNRQVSTTPTPRSRSWKSLFVRVGLATGVVYFYNTSKVFAEGPTYTIPGFRPSSEDEGKPFPTLESSTTSRQATAPVPNFSSQPVTPQDEGAAPSSTSLQPTLPTEAPSPSVTSSSLENTEEEASQQGAFNEETGEINWDCPCLGGMAHGTCGEQFRAAFSCFVYSKEDPKGMDCIEHFKTMQGCFREHPDEYGAELEDEEEEGAEDDHYEGGSGHRRAGEGVSETAAASYEDGGPRYPSGEPLPEPARKGLHAAETRADTTTTPSSPITSSPSSSPTDSEPNQRARPAKAQAVTQHPDPVSESEDLVPKAAHDARGPTQDEKV